MAETDVSIWNLNQVISWFKGLDNDLQNYIPNLEEASIIGTQLLALTYEDLNNLGIVSIGHQEVILEATDLLKHLHFDLDNENLQSRALDLNCRCRALRSSISSRKRIHGVQSASGELSMGPNMLLLRLACEVLDSSKLLVMWLDRPPFWSQPETRQVRRNLVRLSYELSTTVQQSVFACVIDDAASAICKDLEISANHLIVSNDPMTIQPASLEVAHFVNKDASAGLGLYIKATFEGHHVITGSKEGSISSRIRRIGLGDEVVAVGGQTVIGWHLSKLVGLLKEDISDISITLKKRPHLHAPGNTATPTARRQIQERVLTVPPPVSPIRKVADSRKNSIEDVIDVPKAVIHEESDNILEKKKRKLKKRKAKSAGNLLSGGGATKRSMNSQSNSGNSLDTSSHHSSLHSISSAEMLSANNLRKNTGIRGSLENILKFKDNRSKKKANPQDGQCKTGNDRKSESTLSNSMNDLLNMGREIKKDVKNHGMKKTKRTKKTRSASHNDVLLDARNSSNGSISLLHQEYMTKGPDLTQTVPEPPTSPLDFLVIPPPPQAPYTPRNENALRINIDSANDLSSAENSQLLVKNGDSESPNSIMDIEHCRRFTIIGNEQMDDKWYNSLLTEVNTKRVKRSRAAAKQVLEKVSETAASDDSVFFNTTVENTPEKEVVVRRPKPRLINRPASMPPNYYSPSKLQQFRNRVKLKSGLDEIPPVVHHVDSRGIKKLAPLNSIKEKVGSNFDTRQHSEGNRNSWCSNNNNNSAGTLLQSVIETPSNFINSSSCGRNGVNNTLNYDKNMSRRTNIPENLSRAQRSRSMSEEPHDLLHIKSTTRQPSPVKQDLSKTERIVETSHDTKTSISDELTKYFLRKREGKTPDSSSSTTVSRNTSIEHPPVKVRSTKTPDKIRTPMMPPVPKPRTKLRSTTEKLVDSSLDTDSQKSTSSQQITFQSPPRKFLFDNVKTNELPGDHHFTASSPKKPVTRLLANTQSSPTSRGSYVAAMDIGYALESLNRKSLDRRKDSETSSVDADNSSFKVVGGVKVRLRKPVTKSNTKKGLILLDDMRSQRRISCRDLGQGECNGWLLKKKLNSNSPLSSKWTKRWVVLKDKAMYCYHTPDDDKAESYISLPGYQVTPAPECKKKFAFRVSHPKRKTFYFASDRQMDMSRWMNKLGLAAIEYGFSQQSIADPDQHSKSEEYYSESDSEDAFMSPSETSFHTTSCSPSSSPEKTTRVKLVAKTRSEYDAARQTPGQPILNRSARFPKEKAKMLHDAKVTTFTQTSDSLQNNNKNRPKSEAAIRTKILDFNTIESNEHHSSHSNISLETVTPARQSPEIAKQRVEDIKRKSEPRSSSGLDVFNMSTEPGEKLSFKEQEETQHSESIMTKKAEEVSRQSLENNNKTEVLSDTTNDRGKVSSKLHSGTDSGESKARENYVGQPGVQAKASSVENTKSDIGSIGDLCKALQHAEVDIHGIKRTTTLRRKMTILSRNPKKNESMLKKRALERQLKALEGELEYYNLLDEKKITSGSLHQWMNQHPSLFAELGTIRKMSKIRRKPAEEVFFTENVAPELQTRTMRPSSYSESESLQTNKTDPNLYQPNTLDVVIPKPRPRSCAMSNSDYDKLKRSKLSSSSISPSKLPIVTRSEMGYLETDL